MFKMEGQVLQHDNRNAFNREKWPSRYGIGGKNLSKEIKGFAECSEATRDVDPTIFQDVVPTEQVFTECLETLQENEYIRAEGKNGSILFVPQQDQILNSQGDLQRLYAPKKTLSELSLVRQTEEQKQIMHILRTMKEHDKETLRKRINADAGFADKFGDAIYSHAQNCFADDCTEFECCKMRKLWKEKVATEDLIKEPAKVEYSRVDNVKNGATLYDLGFESTGSIYNRNGSEIHEGVVSWQDDGFNTAHMVLKKVEKKKTNEEHVKVLNEISDHQNLCMPELVLTTEDHTFQIMPKAEMNLLEFSKNCPNEKMDTKFVPVVTRQLFDSIQHLHNSDVVHTDVKTTNILVSDNQLKLADTDEIRKKGEKCGRTTKYFKPPKVFEDNQASFHMDQYGVMISIAEAIGKNVAFNQEKESVKERDKRLLKELQTEHLDIFADLFNQIVVEGKVMSFNWLLNVFTQDVELEKEFLQVLNEVVQKKKNTEDCAFGIRGYVHRKFKAHLESLPRSMKLPPKYV